MRKLYHSKKKALKIPVVVILGPTASGKSALAVRLAKRYRGEIVSADSRQVYRGLNVATGKITKREMAGIPHHLLSIVDPKKQFTADDFVQAGRAAVADIAKRGKLPIICGGTGFYIDALLGKLKFPNVRPDLKLRTRLQKKSAENLFIMLKKIDPKRARTIERHNPVRLIRAIEIAKTLGSVPKQVSERNTTIYRSISIGIRPSDAVLKRRIRARTALRMRRGMVAEGRRLLKYLGGRRMRELGLEYRHLADYLKKEITKEELVRRIDRDDWRYAKRQLRWFARNKSTVWFPAAERRTLLRQADKWFRGVRLRQDKS